MAAACCAAENGQRVVMLDNNRALGGQIWRGEGVGAGRAQRTDSPAADAIQWIERVYRAGVSVIAGAQVYDAHPARDATEFASAQAETAAGRCDVRCRKLIIATGARERFLPFPGWTLPGAYGAGGLQAMVKAGLPVAGKRVVVAGSGPLLLAVAAFLRSSGADVRLVAEQAPAARLAEFGLDLLRQPARAAQALRLQRQLLGVRYLPGCWITSARGDGKLTSVNLQRGTRTWEVACDLLACGFHLAPNLELPMLLGCGLRNGFVQVNEYQESSRPGIFCAGEITGIGGVDLSLLEGQIAGHACAGNLGQALGLQAQRDRQREFGRRLGRTFALRNELKGLAAPDTVVCRCEDVTRQQLEPYAAASWREAKLHTRCGMGACQGRVCGAAVEFLYEWQADGVRPPLFPVRLESLMAMDGREGETTA